MVAKSACYPSLEEAHRLILQAANRPMRALFLARALRALAHIAEKIEPDELVAAAGEPNDYGVLLSALLEPGSLSLLDGADPLNRARLRGLRDRRTLLMAEGGTLTAADAAALLGISRQAVDKRRKTGRLLGISLGRRGYAYPAWQFVESGLLPHLDEILTALRDHGPWMQLAFFVSPNPLLQNQSPLQQLRSGRRDDVIRAARAFLEQAAA